MATENEQTLNIENFLGVNRQLHREDLDPKVLYAIQNMYEKKLGALEKRGGSVAIKDTWPSNITGLDNLRKFYDRDFEQRRMVAAHCTIPTTSPVPNPLTGFSAAFTGTGNWFSSSSSRRLGTTNTSDVTHITLEFVGYGIKDYRHIFATSYGVADTLLRITVPSGLDANIKGINVYARTYVDRRTVGLNISNIYPVWAGYIDLIDNPTGGTFDFTQAPESRNAAGLTNVNTGTLTPTYTLSGATGGTLTPGKKYYVLVLSQQMNIDVNWVTPTTKFSRYHATAVTSVQSITLKSDETAINIDSIVGDSLCYGVAVGEHPDLLTLQFITNSSSAQVAGLDFYTPNILGINRNSGNDDYGFIETDHSVADMLIRVDDDGSDYPIYVGRLTTNNSQAITEPHSDFFDGTPPVIFGSSHDSSGLTGYAYEMSAGAKFQFEQLQDLVHFVNDDTFNVLTTPIGSNFFVAEPTNDAGLYLTNGLNAAGNVLAYNTPSPPKSKYITKYQESLVIGGGTQGSESFSRIYVSQAIDHTDFSQTGAGSSLAFFNVGLEGEPINGLGIYSYTTGTDGPRSQLLAGKRNGIWSLTDLPSGAITGRSNLTNLSSRVGPIGQTLVNTTVGTIFTSNDNVYLVEASGEPVAIGDAIEPDIRNGNLSNAIAIFHDDHYKLSFASAGSSFNDVEFWLDTRKMRMARGRPIWLGPFAGRNVDYSYPEILNQDTEDRICVDKENLRVYQADVDGTVSDFGTNITAIMDFGDLPMRPAGHANKLLERWSWTIKILRQTTFTDKTTIDRGKVVETKTQLISPPDGASWAMSVYDKDVFDAAWHKAYTFFPSEGARLSGQTIRKTLTHSGADNISVSGLAINFKVERRRI